jgi:hypothetical protein
MERWLKSFAVKGATINTLGLSENKITEKYEEGIMHHVNILIER